MMDPKELLRRIGQNASHQPETDRFGRTIPDRMQIEDALSGALRLPLSKRDLRRIEKQTRRHPERG